MKRKTLIFQRQKLTCSNLSFKLTKISLGSLRCLDLEVMVGGHMRLSTYTPCEPSCLCQDVSTPENVCP